MPSMGCMIPNLRRSTPPLTRESLLAAGKDRRYTFALASA